MSSLHTSVDLLLAKEGSQEVLQWDGGGFKIRLDGEMALEILHPHVGFVPTPHFVFAPLDKRSKGIVFFFVCILPKVFLTIDIVILVTGGGSQE